MRQGAGLGATLFLGLALASCAAPSPATPAATPSSPPGPVAAAPAPVPRVAERWTGLALEPVTESLARALGLPRVEGLYVRDVERESPGAYAGIRAGDVLLLAGGTYLGDLDALSRVLGGAAAGSAVELVVRRAGGVLPSSLPVQESPPGRLVLVIEPPVRGLIGLAADAAVLWAYGPVANGADRGIVPIQLPGGPVPPIGPRPVASPGAERVIAVDAERVYLGWAGSELYIDVYELGSGRVGRLPVRGAESLANRCRPQGLARVLGELWMACQRPDGPAIARIDLGSGTTRIDPLPATYWSGLAYDGEAVLWLCCQASGAVSLARTELASGTTKVFPLPERVTALAAEPGAVYLLGPNAIYQHKPWR